MIDRPLAHGADRQTPRRIIVHAMAYQLDYEGEHIYAATFLDRIGLSAHILVAPDGTLIRCRDDEQGAWHARGHNTDSLGVEILVPGVYDYGSFLQRIAEPWAGDVQFSAAVDCVTQWCSTWNIPPEPGTLDRHSDVDPDRKYDPGRGFHWDDFVTRVKARMEAV